MIYTHEEINEMQDQLHTAIEAIEMAHSVLENYGSSEWDEAHRILEKAINEIHGRKKEGEK